MITSRGLGLFLSLRAGCSALPEISPSADIGSPGNQPIPPPLQPFPARAAICAAQISSPSIFGEFVFRLYKPGLFVKTEVNTSQNVLDQTESIRPDQEISNFQPPLQVK